MVHTRLNIRLRVILQWLRLDIKEGLSVAKMAIGSDWDQHAFSCMPYIYVIQKRLYVLKGKPSHKARANDQKPTQARECSSQDGRDNCTCNNNPRGNLEQLRLYPRCFGFHAREWVSMQRSSLKLKLVLDGLFS